MHIDDESSIKTIIYDYMFDELQARNKNYNDLDAIIDGIIDTLTDNIDEALITLCNVKE